MLSFRTEGVGRVGSNSLISYSSSVPPNIDIKASLNSSEAGRELGREPPPVAASPGDKKPPVPVEGLFNGIVSSEGGREGLGVRTLKQKVKGSIFFSYLTTICSEGCFHMRLISKSVTTKVDLKCYFRVN